MEFHFKFLGEDKISLNGETQSLSSLIHSMVTTGLFLGLSLEDSITNMANAIFETILFDEYPEEFIIQVNRIVAKIRTEGVFNKGGSHLMPQKKKRQITTI